MSLFRLLAWGLRILLMGSSALVFFAVGIAAAWQSALENSTKGAYAFTYFTSVGLMIAYVELWTCWNRLFNRDELVK